MYANSFILNLLAQHRRVAANFFLNTERSFPLPADYRLDCTTANGNLGGTMASIAGTSISSDESTLRHLNEEYIRSFMDSDVEWYRLHLAEDFQVIESDGAELDKAAFLIQTAKGPDVAGYELKKVNVRFYGDVAVVQATGLFTRKDSSTGTSRYTDIYVRAGKDWKVVSAQITRC
jgi:uncharacterized protein DUF4440